MRNDTDIIKGLNLNKDPKGVPNGSLIFAKNIKLDDDGVNLTNEEGFIEALGVDVNGEKLKGHIVGTITCNKEIVLFTYNYSTKQSYIYRAQEVDNSDKLFLLPVQTAWKWSGGVIHGTYTYNVNGDLIIAVGEYSNDKKIPLKTINLSIASFNEDLYSVSPNIPIANLNLISKVSGNNIPNGIYYFFIRYEIEKNYYTNWFPIGIPQYAISRKDTTIIDHYYEVGDNDKFRTSTSSIYNNDSRDCPYNFKFSISFNKSYNYKSYQIGYILQHENTTIAREWRKFNFSNLEFTFDASNPIETSVEKLVETNFNIFNVKTLTNYENRVYIANYDETNYNDDLQKYADNITAKIVKKKLISDSNSVINTTIVFKYRISYNGIDYDLTLPNGNTLVKLTTNDKLCEILARIIGNNVTVQDVKTKGFRSSTGNEATHGTTGTRPKYDISSENVYFDLSRDNLIICTQNGNPYNFVGGKVYFTYSVDAAGWVSSGYRIYPNNITVTNLGTASSTETTYGKEITSKTFMPNDVYNFFIHYIREDGTYTNGYRLNNTISPSNNSNTILDANGKQLPVNTKLKDITSLYAGKAEPNSGEVDFNRTNINLSGLTTIDELKDKYAYEILGTGKWTSIGDFAYYENSNGDKLFKTEFAHELSVVNDPLINATPKVYRQGVGFTNIVVPKGYIGFFFSYEKPEQLNKYEAIVDNSNINSKVLIRASDVETGKVNYNGNLFIPEYIITDGNAKYTSEVAGYIRNSNISVSNKNADANSEDEIDTVGLNGGISLDLLKNNNEKLNPAKNIVGSIIAFNRNIYCKKDKELIPFGPVACITDHNKGYSYADSKDILTTKEYFDDVFPNNTVEDCEFNYPAFYVQDKYLTYNRKVYINDSDGKVYDIDAANTIPNSHTTDKKAYAKVVSYNKFSNINLDALSIKKEPELLVGLFGDSTSSSSTHIKSVNTIVKPINATDLIEFKDNYIEKQHKAYTAYRNDIVYLEHKTSSIRRSNIIGDESTENSWRHFSSDNYKIINKEKGNITNLFGVGNNLYIHTENTILCINKDNTLKAQNTEVQLATRDLFEGEPVEVLIGNHGFGGLQTQDSWCFNHLGYFFVDKDSKRIYLFNDNQLTDLSTDIIALLNNITIDDSWLETDFVNDRVLVCIQFHTDKVAKDYITLSYSLKSKKWLSLHDYYFSRCLNTKNKCYFWGNDYAVANQLFTLSKTANIGDYNSLLNNCFLFPESHIVNEEKTLQSAIFDVIFNDDYLTSKSIDSINYIVNKVFDYADELITRMAEPSMENNTFGDKNHYAGDLLRIYTDSNDTGNIDISINNEVNQYNDYKKPHYNNGYWQFNYFRNAIIIAATEKQLLRRLGVKDKSQLSPEQQAKFDESLKNYIPNDNRNLIYGRYFVVRFIFNNVDNIPFRFETLSINYNAY